MSRVRAYLAMSLDGYVAGPRDDLAWLEPRKPGALPIAAPPWSEADSDALQFDGFLDRVGCILMGRRTYDIVAGFADWPYGDVPLHVATHRPLDNPRATVRATRGTVADVVATAREAAGDGDVYVDGAQMVRTALGAGLLDHLVITLVPTVLGDGVALFRGLHHPAELTVEHVVRFGDGFVQLHLVCRGGDAATG